MSDKDQARQWARQRREPLDFASLSRSIVARLAAWPRLRVAHTVLSYLPMADEVDLRPLHRVPVLWAVTRTPDVGPLTIHRLTSDLERHRYGFEQPRRGADPVATHEIDIALVPGVAFDRSGNRLGHGAGYYDGLLVGLRPNALRIGVVPEALVAARLPAEDHDVPMTHLVTERGITEC